MSINSVYIIGRLGAEPELISFQNGSLMTTLSVATSDRWTDRRTGERKEHTEWHTIIGNNAIGLTMFTNLTKGSLVYIEGKLQTRQYQDKNNITRYITKIVANKFCLL